MIRYLDDIAVAATAQGPNDGLTPQQRACINQKLAELTKSGSGPALLSWINQCVQGNVQVARAWIEQACVTGNLISGPVRPFLCGSR